LLIDGAGARIVAGIPGTISDGPGVGVVSVHAGTLRVLALRAIPVARDAAETPPQPAARASAAANKRRWRSSRNGRSAKYLARIALSPRTTTTY
jgi:hypothetical protein